MQGPDRQRAEFPMRLIVRFPMYARGLRHRSWCITALLAALVLAPLAAQAQIAFRNAASGSALGNGFRAAASSPAGTISFVNAGSQVAGTGSSITPSIPSGDQAGDLAVLIVAGRPSDTAEPAAPSGWSLRSSVLREVGSADLKIMTFYRVLTGGDSNPTVSLPSSWQSGGMSGQIAVWRGVHTSTPFDVADATGTSGASSTWTPPSITTATDGAWVVSAVATADDNDVDKDSANGFTSRMEGSSYDTTNGDDHAVALADKTQTSAGATTMVRWEQDNSASDPWVGITFALRPDPNALVIDQPSGTAQDDVMIASIGVRPSSTTITPPSGWTLVRRINNSNSNSNSLAVYRRVAGSSEPASYKWTLSGSNYAVGGIQSFFGIDTANPIDVENGQTTANGTAHATPSVTTTVANAMLVTSHTFSSNRSWSPPSGMTEAFDVSTGPDSSGGQAIEGNYDVQVSAGSTGTKTATVGGDADVGNTHILALRPLYPGLVISKPAGTVSGDFMVAAIGVQDDSVTITPPSGWTLVRRTNQGSGTDNSLAIYTKAAGGSEPWSYTWTITGSNYSHAVGGIQSFSGVDTTNGPVNAEDGQTTSSSTSHDTPDITPTVANTMLVTAHTFASSRTWTPPSGMTEAYDTASLTPSNSQGQSIIGSYQPHVFLATGTKTATVGGNSDTGNAHILALRPLPVTGLQGGFNAYDTSTAAGAGSGFIRTKVAGTTVSVAIAALNWPRTAVETTFTGTVRVEVLDASNNSGAMDVYGCRSSWTVLQTLSNPTFAAGDNGRKNVSFTQANSYQDLRIRVSSPTSSPTIIGCSNDNFALRPNTFASFSVTDNDWETAGTSRTLGNTALPGGIIHKAGRPFTVQATAVNGAGTPATTTNYTGTPTATLSDCGGSSACPSSMGTLALGASFVGGVLATSTASYDDVGSFNLQLRDTTFSVVDAGDGTLSDCSASGRYVCSGTLAVGRFVPDNFAVALNTPSFSTACGSFTYVGQRLNYATAPVITVTARNFAGGTTTNYAGTLWQITNASLTGKSYAAAVGTLDLTGLPGTDPAINSAGSGTGTLTFGSGLAFTRTTPVAPFDADISLAINVIDADGITSATNPATFGVATPGNGIDFSSSKAMRFGRLVMRNANGSQLMPLLVRVEAQYWTGGPTNSFVTNTQDSCTTFASADVAMGNYTGNLSGSPTCETAITSPGGLSAGRATVLLAAPGAGNAGSVDLTLNLGATASGSSCTVLGGAPGSATTANLPHLQGNWSGGAYIDNPSARATFGIFKGSEEIIFMRENF
jgi:MSHA biogenesis protein MshQ